MPLTYGQLPPLLATLATLRALPLPARTALKVVRLQRAVDAAWTDIETTRQGLVRRYADPPIAADTEVTGDVRVADHNAAQFQADMTTLFAEPFEAPVVFGEADFEAVVIAPDVLLQLGELLQLDA